MTLEEAMRSPAVLDLVRKQAKHARETSTSYSRNPRWWQFLWPRPDFRRRIAGMVRYIVGTRVGKRILFIWSDASWRPSDSTNVFALDTDYAMGVLSSPLHTDWAAGQSSTLEDRIRYTPSSGLETFLWPQAAPELRDRVGKLTAALLDLQHTLCAEHQTGLTQL